VEWSGADGKSPITQLRTTLMASPWWDEGNQFCSVNPASFSVFHIVITSRSLGLRGVEEDVLAVRYSRSSHLTIRARAEPLIIVFGGFS
jgi:hypothetical protein